MASARPYTDFASFWPFYVSQHMRPLNRALHWIGSTIGLFLLGVFVVGWAFFPWNLLTVPAGLVIGYGFAWFGHFIIEKNRPATFTYPLWSFMGDWKMWAYITTGRMRREVAAVQERLDAGWVSLPDRLAPPQDASPA